MALIHLFNAPFLTLLYFNFSSCYIDSSTATVAPTPTHPIPLWNITFFHVPQHFPNTNFTQKKPMGHVCLNHLWLSEEWNQGQSYGPIHIWNAINNYTSATSHPIFNHYDTNVVPKNILAADPHTPKWCWIQSINIAYNLHMGICKIY